METQALLVTLELPILAVVEVAEVFHLTVATAAPAS